MAYLPWVQAPKHVYQANDDTYLVYAHIPAKMYQKLRKQAAECTIEGGEKVTEDDIIRQALASYLSTFLRPWWL